MNGAWLGTFAATLVAVMAAMLALGLGLILGRPPLRGSCGGGTGCTWPCDARSGTCKVRDE